MPHVKAARLLGWTSLAVGITELAATDWLEDRMGVEGHETLIRAFGLRELATGVAILGQPGLNGALAGALWGRVAGDAMDLAALSAAAATTRRPRGLAAVAGVVLAVTGLDVLVATAVQRDLGNAKKISTAARGRVTPTTATPNGAVGVESNVSMLARA